MIRTFSYPFVRGWRNLRQTPVLSFATILSIAVALGIVALFAVLLINGQQVAERWRQDVRMVAYLEQVPDAAELALWREEMLRLPGVADVEYTSPAQALKNFRARLSRRADLLDGLPDDFLPASLTLRIAADFENTDEIDALAGRLRDDQRVADLRYGRQWLERVSALTAIIKLVGGTLGVFLLCAAVLIVANTIRLTLYSRRDELEIMALVGASPYYLKTPYLVEGMIQGGCGGVLALASVALLFQTVLAANLSVLHSLLGIGEVLFLPWQWQVMVMVSGVILGLLGSSFALRRLLRK